ncbi:EamA family transporter [Microbacterium karelineae]|uniref:EamA family transporter n=1 Tax=Microbacterium karelineae TaxID=2654283 RepID=UPI001E2958E6|nr:EamA family transporter [Microbacterium karelineae]
MRPPAWSLAVGAMLSVQLGASLSIGLIAAIDPGGTAWLRLAFGAVIFLLIARPPLRKVRRRDVPIIVGLGFTQGLQTVTFLAAIERIPLGTAVAIEFLGPLTVAALASRSLRKAVWPAVALVGVVVMNEPWGGSVDLVGVGLAFVAAIGWGAYVVLMQKVGDRFEGVGALSLTVPIAAILVAVVGVPQAIGSFEPIHLLVAAGLAVLLPVIPWAFEMLALRRMNATAFGTLMSIEPAFGLLLGFVVLQQVPNALQVVGIVLVIVAGAMAQRGGGREPFDAEPEGASARAG